jgi:hypothetical protein
MSSSAPTSEAPALERLAALLRARGGLTASLLVPAEEEAGPRSCGEAGPASIVAGGPRTGERAEEYEVVFEAIYEGYLLHYGTPRILRPPDEDLGLLVGDDLYALGLARLVALGDIDAVAELADVIALAALARGERREELADAVWAAGARAVGWGTDDAHRRAKALVRSGAPEALEAMRGAALHDES